MRYDNDMSEQKTKSVTAPAGAFFMTFSLIMVSVSVLLLIGVITSLLNPVLIDNGMVLICWLLSPVIVIFSLFLLRIPFKTVFTDNHLTTYGYFGKKTIDLRQLKVIKRTISPGKGIPSIMFYSCLKLKTPKKTLCIHLLSVPLEERHSLWAAIQPYIDLPTIKKPDAYDDLLEV